MKSATKNPAEAQRKERLFYSQAFDGQWMLKDANGAFIGWFGSPALIKQWCDDNGYYCSQN